MGAHAVKRGSSRFGQSTLFPHDSTTLDNADGSANLAPQFDVFWNRHLVQGSRDGPSSCPMLFL